MPHHFQRNKCQFSHPGPFFTYIGRALNFWIRNVTKPNHPLVQTQNDNIAKRFLKISLSGLELSIFPIFCCPSNILRVLEEDFNVDYDFAIYHCLILWSDELMCIWVLNPFWICVLRSHNHYHTLIWKVLKVAIQQSMDHNLFNR